MGQEVLGFCRPTSLMDLAVVNTAPRPVFSIVDRVARDVRV